MEKKHLAMITEIPSCVLSRYLLYKDSTQVEKASANFLKFSKKSIDYVSQRLGDNGSIKNWHEFKKEYRAYMKILSLNVYYN